MIIVAENFNVVQKVDLSQNMFYNQTDWCFMIVFLNGPQAASFCLFSSFCRSNDKYSTIEYGKGLDGVLGIWTQNHRMEGADESTELWLPPIYYDCCFWNIVVWFRKTSWMPESCIKILLFCQFCEISKFDNSCNNIWGKVRQGEARKIQKDQNFEHFDHEQEIKKMIVSRYNTINNMFCVILCRFIFKFSANHVWTV